MTANHEALNEALPCPPYSNGGTAVTHFTRMRREFSAVSMLLVNICAVIFVVAVFVDLAGLLQWMGLINGVPLRILEVGAAITAGMALPLL